MEAVFAKVESDTSRVYVVLLTYFEIYNERLTDLLTTGGAHGKAMDVVCTKAGVRVRGSTPTPVASAAQALKLLTEGDGRRATAATGMNAVSSRSHAVVQMNISSRLVEEEKGLSAVLTLVDLAGSETVRFIWHLGTKALSARDIIIF